MKLEKVRYLAFRLEAADGKPLSPEEAKHAAYEAMFSLWGEAGASKARLRLAAFNEKNQAGVLSCRLAFLEQTIAALALKTGFRNAPIAIRLEKISGTLRTLGVPRRKILESPRQK